MADLDRILVLQLQGPPTSDDGTPVPGEITERRVWARQQDRMETAERPGIGGAFGGISTTRTYRVRYSAEMVDAWEAGRLSVLVGGQALDVESLVEIERRRWLDLSFVWSS